MTGKQHSLTVGLLLVGVGLGGCRKAEAPPARWFGGSGAWVSGGGRRRWQTLLLEVFPAHVLVGPVLALEGPVLLVVA